MKYELHEQLLLKSLNKLMAKQNLDMYNLKKAQEDIDLEENYFLQTIKCLYQKKAVAIGLKRSNYLISVMN